MSLCRKLVIDIGYSMFVGRFMPMLWFYTIIIGATRSKILGGGLQIEALQIHLVNVSHGGLRPLPPPPRLPRPQNNNY